MRLLPFLIAVPVMVGLVTLLGRPSRSATQPVLPAARADAAEFDAEEAVGRLLEEPNPRRAASASPDTTAVAGPATGAEPAPQPEARPAPTLAELREFRSFVQTTLAEVRAEKATASRKELVQRSERMDETVAGLREALGLSTQQADRLTNLLLAELEREEEYLWQWEHGADEAILDELRASDGRAQREALAGILDALQLEAYLAR